MNARTCMVCGEAHKSSKCSELGVPPPGFFTGGGGGSSHNHDEDDKAQQLISSTKYYMPSYSLDDALQSKQPMQVPCLRVSPNRPSSVAV